MKPALAFFGSSLVSAYRNGAATYFRGMIRALAELGFAVTFYEPDAYDRQEHRDIPDPPRATVVVYAADQTGVASALKHARSADVIVKASGVGVFDELLARAVLDVKRPGAMTVFWDVDGPATLERLQQNSVDPFRALVPKYDLVLTCGGQPVVNAYSGVGAHACVPIYNGVDPATHFPVAADPRFAADLGLLANRLPDCEARIDEFFLTAARQLPSSSFVLGGDGWTGKTLAPNVTYVGHVYTHDHNAFNCTPRAVLNVSRDGMARYGFSPATRVFKAAGAGACLLTDEWRGIELFLEPGREVLVARDGEEVASLLDRLTLGRAIEIGDAARRRVLAEHTYERRAAQVDALLDQGALV